MAVVSSALALALQQPPAAFMKAKLCLELQGLTWSSLSLPVCSQPEGMAGTHTQLTLLSLLSVANFSINLVPREPVCDPLLSCFLFW